MTSNTYTYRFRHFLSFVLGGEVLFWLLAWRIFASFGVFSKQSIGERLVFVHPEYSLLIIVSLPLLIGVFAFQMYLRNKRINSFGDEKVIASFLNPVSTKSLFFRYVFIRNVIVFGALSLMEPVLGTKTVEGQAKGLELMFAVDISNSMNTRDVQGGETRLTSAKRAMNQIINQSQVSRVGLVVFAGSAYPQMPLSSD
ncbi:MAG TPA: VWA domain-containing protein, partial [Brumimicrobium sp.]|nr:VWA domain-containing protein [Brumimicrobium sp.]